MPNVNSTNYTPNSAPSILPDLDMPFATGRTLVLQNNTAVLATANGARAAGTVTVSVAGTAGDILPVSVRGVVVNTTVPGSPTTTNVAAAVAAAINATPALAGVVLATSAVAVVTITAVAPGVGGNSLTLAVGTPTGTVAASVTAQMTGGTGAITPLEQITIQVGKNTLVFDAGRPVVVSAHVAAAIAASGRAFE